MLELTLRRIVKFCLWSALSKDNLVRILQFSVSNRAGGWEAHSPLEDGGSESCCSLAACTLSAANWPIALRGGVQQNSPLLLLFPDGVDGKQARRTNSSTPLGELFDHGLDSWACVYFVVTVYSTFGRGSTGVSVFVLYLLLWVVLFSFILSHWEKYNTGILFLPWGYDISQVVSTRRSRCSASAAAQ